MSTLVEAVVGGGRRDQGHRLVEGLLGHAALRHRRLVVLANRRQAALHRRVVHVLEQHGNAGVRVGHGDAAAHGAGADHRGPLDLRDRRVLRHVGHLRGFAIGEEHVHQRARFVRGHAVRKQLALARRALLEVERERAFDGVDGLERRLHAFRGLRQCRPRRRARGDAGLSIGDLVRQLAGLPNPADVAVDCANLMASVSRFAPARRDRRCRPRARGGHSPAFRPCTFQSRARRRRAAAAAACRRRRE